MSLHNLSHSATNDTARFLLGVGAPIALIILVAISAAARARLSNSLESLKPNGQYAQWMRRNIVFISVERLSLALLILAFALFLLFFFWDYEFSLWFFAAFVVAIPIHLAASFLLASRRPRHPPPNHAG